MNMQEQYKLWKGNSPLSLLLYYLLALLLLIGAHHLSPTNLAGPGLDIPAFFIYFILCLALVIKTIMRLAKTHRPYTRPFIINLMLSVLINFLAAACLVVLFISPADSW